MKLNNKPIKLSINPAFVNKTPITSTNYFAEGFETVECTIEDAINSICNDGFAFSYVFKDSYRNTKNFISADLIAVDVDGTRPLHDALNDPFITNNCSFVYTTPSHTNEENRYRVVFQLPYSIECKKELHSIAKTLCTRLSGDPSATDAARLFYGCNKEEPHIFGNIINEKLLKDFINEARVKSHLSDIEGYRTTTHQSPISMDENEVLRTSCDKSIAIKDMKNNTTIYCPRHFDNNPSAFAATSINGTYVHCRVCRKTWWMKGANRNYSFDSFEQLIIETSEQEIESNKDPYLGSDNSNLIPFFDKDSFETKAMLKATGITISEDRYLVVDHLPARINYIKSAKGTGKTTTLSKLITRSQFERGRVLLIGHRQALIGATCKKLNLECYLDDAKFLSQQNKYGVCLDSISKIKKNEYDLIIIDEVEQVIAHIMSDTMASRRASAFRKLVELVWYSKKVVLLDADVSWVSYAVFNIIIQGAQSSLPFLKQKHKHDFTAHVFLNRFKKPSPEVQLYSREEQLINHLIESIKANKRVFVACNSKKQADSLTELAKQNISEEKVLTVTSENSRVEEIQHIITNIDKEILNYQAVFASPSLGTGIDITFEGNEELIDCVYGFFKPLINTHLDIDQQLARVRHPKSVHVWVSPDFYTFETNLGVIVDDHMAEYAVEVFHQQFLIEPPTLTELAPLTATAALVLAKERTSKNNLKRNFIRYKINQDIVVNKVDEDQAQINAGEKYKEISNLLLNEKVCEELMQAPTLNKCDYLAVKAKMQSNHEYVSKSEKHSYYKTNIELFFRQPIDSSLIFEVSNRRLKTHVHWFEQLTDDEIYKYINYSNWRNKEFKSNAKVFSSFVIRSVILRGLLELTPVFQDLKFDCDVVYTANDLSKFAQACKTHKTYIETQLNIAVRSDVLKKPTQQLTRILGCIGLVQDKVRTKTNYDKSKTYYYQLNQNAFEQMHRFMHHRTNVETKGWDYVDRAYGFNYDNEQRDQIIKLDRFLKEQ